MPELAIIVGIEGIRLIAQRTGLYGGRDKTVITMDGERIVEASTTVYRGFGPERVAVTGTAYFDEYYPGEGVDDLWDRMPKMNISRVSEAAAWRCACSQELSGFHTPEEMSKTRHRRPAGRTADPRVAAIQVGDGYAFDPSTAQI